MSRTDETGCGANEGWQTASRRQEEWRWARDYDDDDNDDVVDVLSHLPHRRRCCVVNGQGGRPNG